MFKKFISTILVLTLSLIPFQTQTVFAQSPGEVSRDAIGLGTVATILGAPAWVPTVGLAIAFGAVAYSLCSEDQKATLNKLFQDAMAHGFPLRKGETDVLVVAREQAMNLYENRSSNLINQSCPAHPVPREAIVTEMRLARLFGHYGLLEISVLSNEVLFNAAVGSAVYSQTFVKSYMDEIKFLRESRTPAKGVEYVSVDQERKLREFCAEEGDEYSIFGVGLANGLSIIVALTMVIDITLHFVYGGLIKNPFGWWIGNMAVFNLFREGKKVFEDVIKMCKEERIQSDWGRNVKFIKAVPWVLGAIFSAVVGDKILDYIKVINGQKSNKR